MQRFIVRDSFAAPLYIANQAYKPNSGQREIHILVRDFLRTRINIGLLARIPQPRVTPLPQAIVRPSSGLLNAS